MFCDARLLGIIVGSILALYVANIKIVTDKSLVPSFMTDYYYVDDFPGIYNLKRHQIFQEYSPDTVKIAIVGSSSAESIGCDASWVYKDISRSPMRNISSSCSISSHINLIAHKGINKNHEFFNLAKAGAKFLQVAQISKKIIQSDVDRILYLAQADYFHKGNYGVSNIPVSADRAELISFLKIDNEKEFTDLGVALSKPAKGMSWTYDGVYSFLNIKSSASKPYSLEEAENDILAFTIKDFVSSLFFYINNKFSTRDDEPGEIVLYPEHFEIGKFDGEINKIIKSLKLFELLSIALKEHKVEFNVIFLPDASLSRSEQLFQLRKSTEYQNLNDKGILIADFIDLKLEPVIENFDGKHLTTDGNKKVALKLYDKVFNQINGE